MIFVFGFIFGFCILLAASIAIMSYLQDSNKIDVGGFGWLMFILISIINGLITGQIALSL